MLRASPLLLTLCLSQPRPPDPLVLPALVGIGVTFKRDKLKGCYVVRRVIESGPAALNGEVQPGDEFHEVDGIPVAAKAPEDLTNMVLGPAGSRVDLTIIRHGDKSACFRIRSQNRAVSCEPA